MKLKLTFQIKRYHPTTWSICQSTNPVKSIYPKAASRFVSNFENFQTLRIIGTNLYVSLSWDRTKFQNINTVDNLEFQLLKLSIAPCQLQELKSLEDIWPASDLLDRKHLLLIYVVLRARWDTYIHRRSTGFHQKCLGALSFQRLVYTYKCRNITSPPILCGNRL